MLTVELLPAEHGDCIILSYGANPVRRVLIDAGTGPTWGAHLRPRLVSAGIDRLELFVLTHIDADHIAGAIPMLEDPDLPVEIGEVWFNGRPQLAGRFLSVGQGERFSELIRERRIPWNVRFGGKAVCVDDGAPPAVELDGGLRLTVLSPTRAELDRLAKVWKKEIDRLHLGRGRSGTLRRQRFLAREPNPSTVVGELAATRFQPDTSKPNGSSIALLAEFEGSSVVLAGDAYSSVLKRSLRSVRGGGDRLRVDALKVSHHGSRGNTDTGLIDLLDCDRYLISCNGAVHKLPDNEAIGRIIRHCPGRAELLFNYHCPRTECWDDAGLQGRYGFSATYGSNGYLEVTL